MADDLTTKPVKFWNPKPVGGGQLAITAMMCGRRVDGHVRVDHHQIHEMLADGLTWQPQKIVRRTIADHRGKEWHMVGEKILGLE
jgi:hypothetical protein